MVAEFLMERYGWDAVWFLGSNGLRRGPLRFLGPGTCAVGVWTGPDADLLCVKECHSLEEAEGLLSPEGWTITHAAICAWLKLTFGGYRSSPFPYGSSNKGSRNLKACREGWSSDG